MTFNNTLAEFRRLVGELLWAILASIITIGPIKRYIIRSAMKTPFFDLPGYMRRWWLFNPYKDSNDNDVPTHNPAYPAIRVHHILREDYARDPHDHPWPARTIILDGWYDEDRFVTVQVGDLTCVTAIEAFTRKPGDTAALLPGEYHTITRVSVGGVWTLFFTWPWETRWGFLVKGQKVHWRDYAENGEPEVTQQFGAALKPHRPENDWWPEDAALENGDYENDCVACGERFFGHKRRVICKRCDYITNNNNNGETP